MMNIVGFRVITLCFQQKQANHGYALENKNSFVIYNSVTALWKWIDFNNHTIILFEQ